MSLRDRLPSLLSNGERQDRRPPAHVPDQRDLITQFFDSDEDRWLVVLDAGRYDYFDRLVDEFFEGELRRCWNGGIGYTGDWFLRNVRGDYGDRGLFSWVPLREQQGPYDGRDHFTVAPEIEMQDGVNARLAALGYTDGEIDSGFTEAPARVNHEVREHIDALNGGLVRYIKPHPPFDGLEELTSESTKTAETQAALDKGRLSDGELADAYESTYRAGFEYAQDIVDDLDGRVVVTADHGTCLTCGQLFHGRHHDPHDHLTIVPWFELEGGQ